MSEVNEKVQVLNQFTDVNSPLHVSMTGKDHVLVADYWNHRILLLTGELRLERVIVDGNSQTKLQCPWRLHGNELASQLYVVHGSSEQGLPGLVSTFTISLAHIA